MAVVMGWLGRARLRARPASQALHLVHPHSTLVVSLVTVVLLGGFAVACIILAFVAYPTASWPTIATFLACIPFFLGFALLGVAGAAAYVRENYTASEQGIQGSNFLGANKELQWRDLRSVRYAPLMQWFRLETRTGNVVRISAMLMGLPEFARFCLMHAPKGAIDAETLALLRATAAGNPPPLWE